jgi:hypothetical protein
VVEPASGVPYDEQYREITSQIWDDQIKAIATQVIEHGISVVERLDEYRNDLTKQKMIIAAGLWMQKELHLYDTASEPKKRKTKRKPQSRSARRRTVRRSRHGK